MKHLGKQNEISMNSVFLPKNAKNKRRGLRNSCIYKVQSINTSKGPKSTQKICFSLDKPLYIYQLLT